MSASKPTKYIFVLGGVMSGLGKGIAASSIGYLLKQAGVKVTIMKLDPYLNVDPGTMNPYQHGEVFVLDDGSETDLDLGHYERFIDVNMTKNNNATAGQIYSTVLDHERKGEYLGETVQVIPHVTDEIIQRIKALNTPKKYDVVICEVGGTVGDIESLPFMEAIRQLSLEVGYHNHMIFHVTLLPYVKASGELKSKPTQHSVMKLREIGLTPDMIFCRSEYPIEQSVRDKIALFCNVRPDHVIEGIDVPTIYEVPLLMHEQNAGELINERLKIEKKPHLKELRQFIHNFKNPVHEVTIAMCGKYTELIDSYKSVMESFIHSGVENNARVNVKWVQTEKIKDDKSAQKAFAKVDGILLLPGFGSRGSEGKIWSSKFARENNIPFLGICLGLQCAVIDFARNVCGMKDANSTEFNKNTKFPVIDLMESQRAIKIKGGTMRLGAYDCEIKTGTKTFAAYRKKKISERHRHRYEVNNRYRSKLEKNGLIFSGVNEDLGVVEAIEFPDHPWFVAGQFHPELKSRVNKAHPLFREFIKATVKQKS
ncbi:MAG: CTP synthase [Candidatus Marinimicrobia bacterium]|jgi:CTP synthase|nr:CTP synthase [Candidatus Neomarinimicrobiota bacterium]MBT4155656.1 CTP synthase [Candidatus Neomarinimicrobiota bacterium]MBT4555002.1 CTP synthase [Candidatus Neomarinimicrobiota bacterium]MBT4752064.1 CTP synthase [Candidatus Neomarinimicrobiota bacterium]MBT5115272.1 CTP synthase [Candidatus Neomarinimicrobiota bacterium]|tara:strand:- start:2691 stop:4307 length:1617 start_codon:yes stop_codon:yes gene_type:complete